MTPTNNPDRLMGLAEACESASANEQRALIESAAAQLALCQLWPPRGDDVELAAKFYAFLNVGAFSDAAMSLARDFGGQVTFFKDGTAKAFLWQPYPLAVEAKASTPALALTAAALRALAMKEGSAGS